MSYEELTQKYRELTLESVNHWDYRRRSKSEKDYVHGFCTYPAMMVPKMQREMLDVYLESNKSKNVRILDPFAGAGTILVEGMLKGLDVVGIDINPLAILLCKAKTTIINPKELKEHASALISRILVKSDPVLFNFDGINKWFTERAIRELSTIRAEIMEEPIIEIRRFFWASFCEVVRIVSNSRNCTYKLHIKEKKEIEAYNKDAIQIFVNTLTDNIKHFNIFYNELLQRKLLKADGITYKRSIKIILGNSIQVLKHSRMKYDVVFTSPPYGDNHTTVTYGQYSVLPLRWMDIRDIDEGIDENIICSQCEIDNISLGGKKKVEADIEQILCSKSLTLNTQVQSIKSKSPKQIAKIISFYYDFDLFLQSLSKRLKPNAITVWTVGNRQVAKQEIYMDKILVELGMLYKFRKLTAFSRTIYQKRMPETNAHSGDVKGIQETMTREHILIFYKEE